VERSDVKGVQPGFRASYNTFGKDARQDMLVDCGKLVECIRNNQTERTPYLVGIDGPGGSGKSYMSRRIESELPDVQVVQFDDFYVDTIDKTIDRKIGDHFDWIRLQEEVLVPLTQKREANYQVYDWELGRLHSWKTVSPHGIVVIDGIYSTRSELRHFYNLTVFVYAEYNVRLQRGIDRDGTNSRSKWVQEWMPEEVLYMGSDHKPRQNADMVIQGIEKVST
jgi:uridine kinase